MKTLRAKSWIAFLVLALLNGAAALVLFRSAAAQSTDSNQINLAGAQRMLSQKMTKEALLAARGDDAKALRASIDRFDQVLHGLSDGDASLKLPATKDPEILAGLASVSETWAPIRGALLEIAAQPKKADMAYARVIAENMTLLSRMDKVVKLYEKHATDKLTSTIQLQFALTAILILLLFGSQQIVLRQVIGPLTKAVEYVGSVAAGDLRRELAPDIRERGDEIGDLGRAIQLMAESLRTMIREISAKTGVVLSSLTVLQERAAAMSSGSRATSDKAHTVAAAAEEMSANVTTVASSMEVAATNLDRVARATGEMTLTIREIASNSERAKNIADEAARQASRVSDQIGQLQKAANEIDMVTETIMQISTQTSLLALNATIEAARAGASGKGFAVVATEIKALAQQAAAATDDIKLRTATIQSATADSVGGVTEINRVITEVNDFVASIAAAIEEQSSVTESMSNNIREATEGVRDTNERVSESSMVSRTIAQDIAQVDHVAGDMASSSDSVQKNAVELAKVSEQLQQTVARFQV